MDDKTLINPVLILIKKTGKYIRAYEDWLAKPDAKKTYVNLKEFWRKEHLKMKRTNPSASTYGYGMNATAESSTDQQDMAAIFEQCANAMMNSQREMQERQQQFEANMTANIMNLQNQMNQAATQQNSMLNNAMQNNANMQSQMASALQQQAANRTNTTVPTTGWRNQAWNAMQQGGRHSLPARLPIQQQQEPEEPIPRL